eukprot:gene324-6738_t
MSKKKKQEKKIPETKSCNLMLWTLIFVMLSIIYTMFIHRKIVEEAIPAAQKYIPEVELFTLQSKAGQFLAKEGYKSNHPIIAIPGYITTSLNVWKSKECARTKFRNKMWGGFETIQNLISDRFCWLEHMSLNKETGLDPTNIKLRALFGLESVDYVFPGYWVWAKIILELGEIGYDSNNLKMMSYDWRLGFDQLQERDKYFTILKNEIELQKQIHKKKVFIIGHSLGAVLFTYFLQWIQKDGNVSNKWVDEHISHFYNIAGPLLGVPKAVSAIYSGETKDTSNLFMHSAVENIFTIEQRYNLFRSWGSLTHMLPKGDEHIWKYPFINFSENNLKNITMSNLSEFLKNEINDDEYVKYFKKNVNLNLDKTNTKKDWSNPLISPLPNAPNLKIYCGYGIGKFSENGYYYSKNTSTIDISKSNESLNLESGVFNTNGDGTVPLISLGYMCEKGWKNKELNPSNLKVITKQYLHDPSMYKNNKVEIRPATSSDHVDIMGNTQMLFDILHIASGNDDKIKETIYQTSLHQQKE